MTGRMLRGRRYTIYGLAIVVGVAGGLFALGFEYLLALVLRAGLHETAGFVPAEARGDVALLHQDGAVPGLTWWWLLVLPALGCAASAMLCELFGREARGPGTDPALDAYHNGRGRMRGRVPVLKLVASALTLGSGGSGGREGPISQIGAGIGSFLGQRMGLGDRGCRTLLAAGMAAGVGAVFRAPFAGALFAAEILYRDAEIESEVVVPAFLASASAYCVFCGSLGEFGTLFALPPGLRFERVDELLAYTALAAVLVLAIVLFTRTLQRGERLFARLPLPAVATAAVGGLLTGAVALLVFALAGDERALAVLGSGYGILQQAFDGQFTTWAGALLLVAVAAGKMLATAATVGGGGSAGVFGPSMVIGGTLGFFAGAAKTPISTIVMVTELTGSYQLLLPAVWVCGLTFLLSRRTGLYRHQVDNRALSPAHRGEYLVALLERMTVADVFERSDVVALPASLPLREIVRRIAEGRQDYFPVVDDDGRFVGMLSAHDVREFTFDVSVYDVAIAQDVMSSPPVVVRPKDDLHRALELFDSVWLDELPVVADDDPNRVLGRLRRRAINRAYTRRLGELKALRQAARDGADGA
jgi:chloride channel protein, CIC family